MENLSGDVQDDGCGAQTQALQQGDKPARQSLNPDQGEMGSMSEIFSNVGLWCRAKTQNTQI